MAGAEPQRWMRPPKVRVQFDLSREQVLLLEVLESRLGSRSRADLFQEALGVLLWYVQERRRGRKVVSIDPAEVAHLRNVVELAVPSATPESPEIYEHLVARPHPWRRQLSLKGRNQTVGQLVATMRANGWSPHEAADQLDLSTAQVSEALRYYAANEDLIEEEFREEARLLQGVDGTLLPPPKRAETATQ